MWVFPWKCVGKPFTSEITPGVIPGLVAGENSLLLPSTRHTSTYSRVTALGTETPPMESSDRDSPDKRTQHSSLSARMPSLSGLRASAISMPRAPEPSTSTRWVIGPPVTVCRWYASHTSADKFLADEPKLSAASHSLKQAWFVGKVVTGGSGRVHNPANAFLRRSNTCDAMTNVLCGDGTTRVAFSAIRLRSGDRGAQTLRQLGAGRREAAAAARALRAERGFCLQRFVGAIAVGNALSAPPSPGNTCENA